MIIFYESVNANKLVDELQNAGLLDSENMVFFPKDNGLDIRFADINEEIITDENDVIITTYTKRSTTKIVDEELGTSETIEVWKDYDPTNLFAAIQAVVDTHDPTPYKVAAPNLTDAERIDRLEIAFLQIEGVI